MHGIETRQLQFEINDKKVQNIRGKRSNGIYEILRRVKLDAENLSIVSGTGRTTWY